MNKEMNEKMKIKVVYGLILCFGFMCAGFFPGYYYFETYKTNNSVVVKGLSEMNVKADLGIWNIKFSDTGNDITISQKKIASQLKTVINFLNKAGFAQNEISVGTLVVVDKLADRYASDVKPTYRYILTQGITVRSNNVDLIEKTYSSISQLLSKGIIFVGNEYSSPITYLFTGLNDIKPKMLEESTKSAKESANEFAKASDSKVGKIRKASQGVFSITPQDGGSERQASVIDKKVRVVSTIEYWLD